jgi:hypothetical protein
VANRQVIGGSTLKAVGHATHRVAYFSDRGRLFQSDRGRRFSVITDGRRGRASEVVNVAQSSAIRLKRGVAKRLVDVLDADISTAAGVACDERTTRWVCRVYR